MIEEVFHLGIKALIKNKNGQVLLLKINPQMLSGFTKKPYWDIPGGRMERNSNVEKTLKREILEETGINKIESYELISSTISNIRIPVGKKDVGLILFVYLCTIGNYSKVILSDEHSEYGWFSMKEVVKKLRFKYPEEFLNKVAAKINAAE